jgi:hypothetical protein
MENCISRSVAPKDRADMLRAWAFAEEIGDYPTMSVFLERHRSAVELSDDPDLKTSFKDYSVMAEAALSHEAVHGIGTMRKLEHPWWPEVLAAHDRLRCMEASGTTGWLEPGLAPNQL